MNGLRGFGFTVSQPGGAVRHWYDNGDGIKRDLATDQPLPDPLAGFTAEQLAEAEQTQERA